MQVTDLAALLDTLQSHGVTEYITPELTLRLGPIPAPAREAAPGEDAFDPAIAPQFDEVEDPRFFLERIHSANHREAK